MSSRVTIEGEEWYGTYEGPIHSCWTYGPLTAKLDSMDHTAGLLALAEHALALGDAADFEHLVAVDNLLLAPWMRRLSLDAVPPMLALRHLQIVGRAASRLRSRPRNRGAEALQLAWVIGRSDVLAGPEGIGSLQVMPYAYWNLYERYADAPEAETLAWAAASVADALISSLDECETECILSNVPESTMRYWVAFPEGSHIIEALERGAARIVEASRNCVWVTSSRIERSPWLRDGIEERIVRIRSSLDAVTVSAKEALLMQLDELDYWCRPDGVQDLDDPRTIPRLVRVFNSGRAFDWEGLRFEDAAVQGLDDEDPPHCHVCAPDTA